MSNVDFIRRAFELADTGQYTRVSQIRSALLREDFTLSQLTQLAGKKLHGQLKARILAARSIGKAG